MKPIPFGFLPVFAAFGLLTTGCQSDNFYFATQLPAHLQAEPLANTREVDLTRIAAPTGGGDRIVAGDVLQIAISLGIRPEDQVSLIAGVRRDGTIQLPQMGDLEVQGLEPQAAAAIIQSRAVTSGQYQAGALTVNVAFESKKMNIVRVLGGVESPGTYELRPGASDIVSAIAAAQGLKETAGDEVRIKNPAGKFHQPTAIASTLDPYSTLSSEQDLTPQNEQTISLVSATTSGTNTYVVEDGGVVMIAERDPAPIQVMGLVRNPDTYDFPLGKSISMLKAVARAGGRSNQVADKVYVIRQLPLGQRIVIQCSIRRAKQDPAEDIVLAPGDIVSVEQTPATVMLEAFQLIRFGISGSAGLF